jgi:hypothetical protein
VGLTPDQAICQLIDTELVRGRWKVGKLQNLHTLSSTVCSDPSWVPAGTGFLAALDLVFPTGRKHSQSLGTMAIGLPALQ